MKKIYSDNILQEEISTLECVDFYQEFYNGRVLKKDLFSEVRLVVLNSKVFFVKFYKDKSRLGKVKRLLNFSRGWKVFCDTQDVYRVFSFLPRPLAYFEVKQGGFYIAEGFSASVDLRVFEGSDSADLIKFSIINRVAIMLADLHNVGFSHGDMKWGNVLFCQNENSLYFVDWDSCKKTNKQLCYVRDIARFIVGIREASVSGDFESEFLESYTENTNNTLINDDVYSWVSKFELRHKAKKYEGPRI